MIRCTFMVIAGLFAIAIIRTAEATSVNHAFIAGLFYASGIFTGMFIAFAWALHGKEIPHD